jgi:FecR protein
VSKDDKKTTLRESERTAIKTDDRIRTLAASTAIVFWADGSVTRLSEKTNISLLELRTDPNGSTQVDISLSEGKTWTNIVRMLDPESSFKQRFDNDQKVAAVRGTQFAINLDREYLQTASHAVDITDTQGTILTTVPAGKSVSTSSIFDLIAPESLDSTWQALNTASDAIIAQERIQKLQSDLRVLIKDPTLLARVQEWIRSLFGINSGGDPITVSVVGGALAINVDPSKLSTQDTEMLKSLYERLSNSEITSATMSSKSQIESSLLSVLPPAEAKKYEAIFARSSLYDSWRTLELGLSKDTAELRKKLEKYSQESGITDDIIRIQEALPKETVDKFNVQIQKWKESGTNIPSMNDWLNTLKPDIEQAKDFGRSLIDSINN